MMCAASPTSEEKDLLMNTRRTFASIVVLLFVSLFAQESSAFYASHLGRWVNRDPIEYRGGNSYNLYEYVSGMPLYFVDPSGLRKNWDEFDEIKEKYGPRATSAARGCVAEAKKWQKKLEKEGEKGPIGGNVDALRHCFMFCCLAKKLGKNDAIAIADIHEKHNPPHGPNDDPKSDEDDVPPEGWKDYKQWQRDDRKMDDHNNREGAGMGAKDSECDCAFDCKRALNGDRLQVNDPDGYDWPNGGEDDSSFD